MGSKAWFCRRSLPFAALVGVLCTASTLSGKQYSFKAYSRQDGLLNQVINCLFQDHRGFLWAGTQNGLYRYDGFRFSFFGPADGLPDGTIQSLYESTDGTLWVGTRLGLARFDGVHFIPDPILGRTEIFGYSNIVVDPRGQIYVGTARGLAVSAAPSRKTQTSENLHFRFITKEAVHGVYLDPGGTLWFGAAGNLNKIENGTDSIVEPDSRLPKDRWDAMLVDSSGTFWVRSSERLYFRPKGVQAFQPVKNVPHSPEFGSLYETKDGSVFVPTDGGLMRFSGGVWSHVGARQGLVSDESTCVLQDREGSVWVGMGGEGLERWLGFNEWKAWKTADGLRSDIIWDIERDSSGQLWVATESGLHVQDPKTGDMLLKAGEGLSVRSVLDDPEHHAVWYGANPGGVFRLDRKTGQVQNFGIAQGLTNQRISQLFWGPGRELWATTRAGLFRASLRGESVHFAQQDLPYTDPNEGFFGHLLDHHGRLWVGGSRGIVVLDQGQWRRFSRSDGLIGEGVSHLTEAPDGAIWLGYLTNSGVSRLVFENNRAHFDHFTTRNGLTSDSTVFISADTRGSIWVGSDNGVDVYARSRWRHIGTSDGLVWDDCDSLAFLSDLDGSVWIGTSGGLSHFQASPGNSRVESPEVYITSVKAGSRLLDSAKPGSIPYRDRSLLINFAAPTFLNEAAVRFRYRMLGLEKDWTDAEDRYARYANLAAGDYTFEVLGRDSRGRWSQKPATLKLEILPPWWETRIVRVLEILLVAYLGRFLWKYRIRYLLRKQQLLEDLLAQARTADRLKSEALADVIKGEAREKNRSVVLELIGSHQPLSSVLNAIVNMVEMDDGNTLCLIHTLHEKHFRYGASRALPHSFSRLFEGLPVSFPETCFATAARRISTVGVENIAEGSLWSSHRYVLENMGITCSRSAPILSNAGEVLGTLTYFRTTPFIESAQNVCSLENATRLAGVAIEHLRLYEQLSYRAQYDGLTEIPNRVLFHDRLREAIVRAKQNNTKLWVLWLDLDGFKRVNDTLGHHSGDFLLQTVARRISRCLRDTDTVARVGGDEFTVLVESRAKLEIDVLVQRLISCTSEPVQLGHRQAFVTASVGVSVFPDDGQDADELIRKADLAMYHVKKSGKNAHDFFAPAMASLESNRIEIESNLRTALAGREFELVYQPQCDLSGRLAGFEALLRWNNPRLGRISPARFIPVAEEIGLIVPIGQWVLEEACRQAAVWLQSGHRDFRLAVNVSARQFARSDFPESVAHMLAVMGVPPEIVELELTETVIMSEVAKSSAQLRHLRELGVKIAIDDFGTGYSSLSYLQRLPVDSIKIDQSFVQALCYESSSSLTMVQAIVNLAHDLKLQVIAEGVETDEQMHCLRNVGCDLAQGYLLNKPLSISDATALLAQHNSQCDAEEEQVVLCN